jgi:ATP-dependent RNA helicase SUPV3L1/SUV3
VPADGIVSCEIDPEAVDSAFYQAIGYPVFGGRAVRIDMLDRVINAVYDSASGGKFEARHDMAEWLGCPIEGLYAVLSAMGHTKIEEPAVPVAEISAEAEPKPKEEQVAAPARVPEPGVETIQNLPEGADASAPQTAQLPQIKPKLATFRLKKGKAFEKSGALKNPARKDGSKGREDVSRKASGDKGAHDQGSRHKKGGGKRNKATNRTPRIMQAGPEKRLEDSPFAVLQQLKVKGDDKG